ncbi:MAG: aminotransferase class V-fold PLP-dependent enzyme [Candidatus Bathyarchaeia archaeon]
MTKLGGSRLSPDVLEAIEESNESFCNMWDLIKKCGEIIARITGAEAAWITPGAFSALVLSSAACIAGKDPEKMRQLPHTNDMNNEIIIQRNNRLLLYDRSMEVPGGKFVFIGDEIWGTTKEVLENAFNDKTAAVHYAYVKEPPRGALALETVLEISHDHGIPVIVDAAGMTYPTHYLTKFTDMGADLVCYGGKYLGGPNSTGFVTGRKDLVEAVAIHSFIGTEYGPKGKPGYYRSIGRGYKLDRQEVVALLKAFKHWMHMDHEEERLAPAWKRAHKIEEEIKDLPGLDDVRFTYIPKSGEGIEYHKLGLHLYFDDRTVDEVIDITESLKAGDPEIWVRYGGNGKDFIINTLLLQPGEEDLIVERFKEIFG